MTNDPESQPELAQVEIAIRDCLSRTKSASLETLQVYKILGDHLLKAKEIAKGQYRDWAAKTFGFKRQWCANLTKLAASWSKFDAAREWAAATGREVASRDFSVDGALALIKEMECATAPEASKEPSKTKRPTLREERDKAIEDLKAAQHEIAQLKAEIARLEAKTADAAHADYELGTQIHVQSTGPDTGINPRHMAM